MAEVKINVCVSNQGGEETHFALKSTTKLSRLMQAYADRQGRGPVDSYRFCFDGERINPDHTVDDAGIEDGDIIDAFQEQNIGIFDQHADTAGRRYLDGTFDDTASDPALALSAEVSGGAPPGAYARITTSLLDGRARAALVARADAAFESFGGPDNQLPLSRTALEAIIGSAALRRLEACFAAPHGLPSDGIPAARYRLRRTVAAAHRVINFHVDVTARTMQVPLNAESEYDGGAVLYATATGLQRAPRRPGTATVHGGDVVHGVTALTRGVRHALFLLSATAAGVGE